MKNFTSQQSLLYRCVLTFFSLIIFMSVSGCAKVLMEANKAANPGTKYQPAFASPADVDKFVQLIRENNNKVVSDELGTYFFSVDDKGHILNETYMNNMEDSILRSLFSDAVGIVLPVLVWTEKIDKYSMTYNLEVDWKATQRRHSFFANQVKLKIAPFESTKQYWAAFEAESLEREGKKPYSFKDLSVVLQRSGLKADYVIIPGSLVEDYFSNFPQNKRTNGFDADVNNLTYATKQMTTGGTQKIYFMSFVASANAGVGKSYVMSNCGIQDIIAYKQRLEEMGSQSVIPVTHIKGNKSNNIDELRQAAAMSKENERLEAISNYRTAMLAQAKQAVEAEQACLTGLNGLRVSGSFSSQRLK